jgi:hypothetical protein
MYSGTHTLISALDREECSAFTPVNRKLGDVQSLDANFGEEKILCPLLVISDVIHINKIQERNYFM